jgi:hypothetical protein
MSSVPTLWIVLGISLFVILINLPLGRFRAGAEKYSWRNFGCIFAPVPMVVTIRVMMGLSIKVAPVFLVAAILGQRLGMCMVHTAEKNNSADKKIIS